MTVEVFDDWVHQCIRHWDQNREIKNKSSLMNWCYCGFLFACPFFKALYIDGELDQGILQVEGRVQLKKQYRIGEKKCKN